MLSLCRGGGTEHVSLHQAYLPEFVPSMISVLAGTNAANTVAVLRRFVDLGPLLVDFVHLIIPELARLVERGCALPHCCCLAHHGWCFTPATRCVYRSR
jgi:hypothetical protein